jgi:hypothetical protein
MRRMGAFDLVVMAGGLVLVLLAAQNLPPALTAAAAATEGRPGTFTAARLSCVSHPGHEQCTWLGGFTSDDGVVRRAETGFYGSGRDTFTQGATAKAFDIGRAGQVYGAGGSNEWIAVALLLLAGLALILRPVLRRRAPTGQGAREDQGA